MQVGDPAAIMPHVSIDVADVDAVHARAVAQNLQIVYPLTNEPWGVRRFFLVDPDGTILNVLSHIGSETSAVGG
jgi:predicted enzyme related to lactoylglutathione lyase